MSPIAATRRHGWAMCLCALLAHHGKALADSGHEGDGQSAPALTANIAITSNYVSRGFTQSWGRPAIQGGIDWTHPGGWFAGAWASSLSGQEFSGGSAEIDLYGGYAGSAGGWGYVAGLYQYLYPGTHSPALNGRGYHYTEAKLAFSRGIFSLNTFTTLGNDWFGSFDDARGSLYIDLNLNPDLGHGYTLLLHGGAGILRHHAEANWADAKIGLAKTLPGNWTATIALTGAADKHHYWTATAFSRDPAGNASTRRLGKRAFVVTLGKAF